MIEHKEKGVKKSLKKWICLFLITVLAGSMLLFGGCGSKRAPYAAVSGRGLIHEEEFGGVYIDLTIEDFNALGFAYGDSVDIEFSNGYKLKGIPYYNGFYTQVGEPLLVAYPGYPYIKACINSGDDLWEIAGLNESDQAEITLATHGTYLSTQNARDMHYEDERSLYASDAEFANFRSVESECMRENTLYRSASPCDNQHNRAPYVDDLIAEAGVRFIVNLADNEDRIEGYIGDSEFNSPYFLSLYDSGNVIPLALSMNYSSDEFRSRTAEGLIAMTEHEGPYLVHCTEGKDRTGFVCMLLEALCGASYQEIETDFMITYENYYGITKEGDAFRYDAVVESVMNPMLLSIIGDDSADPAAVDLSECAADYLRDAGMTDEQISALKVILGS